MTTVITQRQTGTRTVAGTDFPVRTVVERQETGSRVEWVLVRGLCNGVPDKAFTYSTKRGALSAFAGEAE